MIRIGRAVVILHVARTAGAAGQAVIVVCMTLSALQICVSSGERETNRIMVKIRWLPGGGVVTSLASLWEIESHVIRVRGFLIIGKMASRAGCRGALKTVAGVTSCAFKVGMHSG